MFELEKDERIRGIDPTQTALAMGFAHDFILEVMLTREMLNLEPEEAAKLSHLLVERWNRRYGTAVRDETASQEAIRRHYATKAFVDRLARKALRRSTDTRLAAAQDESAAQPVEITAEMKRAGAVAFSEVKHLPPEDAAAAIYRAMVGRSEQ